MGLFPPSKHPCLFLRHRDNKGDSSEPLKKPGCGSACGATRNGRAGVRQSCKDARVSKGEVNVGRRVVPAVTRSWDNPSSFQEATGNHQLGREPQLPLPLPHCPTGIAGNGCIRDAGQALLRTDSVTHSSKPTGSLHKQMGGRGRTAHTSGCTPSPKTPLKVTFPLAGTLPGHQSSPIPPSSALRQRVSSQEPT